MYEVFVLSDCIFNYKNKIHNLFIFDKDFKCKTKSAGNDFPFAVMQYFKFSIFKQWIFIELLSLAT